jgi:very-short-patch-repair endonuclease
MQDNPLGKRHLTDHFVPLLPKVKTRVRQLRKDSTGPERRLWAAIRGSQLAGLKFRRQHPIGPFVVDFCCLEETLVIELDGKSHIDMAEEDRQRQEYIEGQGFRVIRFDNDEVLQNIDGVVMAILKACGRNPFTGEKQ